MYSEMNSGQFETDFTVRDFSGYHTFRSGQSKAGVTPRRIRGASELPSGPSVLLAGVGADVRLVELDDGVFADLVAPAADADRN